MTERLCIAVSAAPEDLECHSVSVARLQPLTKFIKTEQLCTTLLAALGVL